MRINLSFCSSEPHFSPERLPKENSGHKKASLIAWILENVKPKCLGRKKKKKMVKDLTLEEWFTKSLIVEKDRGSGYVSESGKYSTASLEKLLNSGDYSSVTIDQSGYFSGLREYSLCLERLLMKGEKVDDGEETGFYSLRRSQSGKEKKKVSFRLPEVSDIILYSPERMDFKV